MKIEIRLDDATLDEIRTLYGENDCNLKLMESCFMSVMHARGQVVYLEEADEALAKAVENALHCLLRLIRQQGTLRERDVTYACKLAKQGQSEQFSALFAQPLTKNAAGHMIYPKTIGQRLYIDALQQNDIVFGVGPAGTGKTFLAVVYAVHLLKKNAVKRIVLTRPAVEAGESLGFLPGDLKEKVDPYLRPLYDALHHMLGEEPCNKMMEKGIIEIAPLAYMRGRTLDDAYIILDEAQNTTEAQMKMFLTRMGFRSKVAITGDVTQIDLPNGKRSGLIQACHLLRDIPNIAIMHLHTSDVVRHPLVQTIIERYEKKDK